MSRLTKKDIFRIVEEEDVAFIRLQFCDIFGTPKNIAITRSQLQSALDNECRFDGSAIDGFGKYAQSDMYLYPDIDSFDIYPWRPQSGKVARMYCDIYTSDKKPYASDSRYILKKVLSEGKEMGYIFKADPELEFFLFDLDDEGQPTTNTHENAGYFDLAPADQGENVRRDIIMNLEDMGFNIVSSHHEISPAQHGIDFTEDDAAKMADMIITFKMAVKTIAKRHGLYATFMPKPKEGVNGSGMHINILCEDKDGNDIFRDGDDLSETAKQFIAGILNHIKGMTLVTNPLVNSYKRLVPGYDAPVNVSWSSSSTNHSALIRIPSMGSASESSNVKGARIELRNPDAACNPYLALALILAAGLDGIKKKMATPEELVEDLKGKTEDEIRDSKLDTLPKTLGEAIEAYKNDEFVKGVLGEQIFGQILDAKHKEWKDFRTCVTQWEIRHYLGKQ
ncbi:type I glutamate--ammonia ligase [Butyrivibrio sp. NC2002]|uniref:type I glutamate--ammonia ligase n=1 Tax=Butyrivibrio sp. NC2002 TaxID=1410610 RepID=UPI00056950C9|nr:type I glutamate--ammonia ligase [Butyrivibrio sp. NC2002]